MARSIVALKEGARRAWKSAENALRKKLVVSVITFRRALPQDGTAGTEPPMNVTIALAIVALLLPTRTHNRRAFEMLGS